VASNNPLETGNATGERLYSFRKIVSRSGIANFCENRRGGILEAPETSDEIVPDQARFELLWPRQQERPCKAPCDFRRDGCDLDRKPVPGSAEICSSQHDACAYDADTDFTCARDRQDQIAKM
jgi:hypothetical protein